MVNIPCPADLVLPAAAVPAFAAAAGANFGCPMAMRCAGKIVIPMRPILKAHAYRLAVFRVVKAATLMKGLAEFHSKRSATRVFCAASVAAVPMLRRGAQP